SERARRSRARHAAPGPMRRARGGRRRGGHESPRPQPTPRRLPPCSVPAARARAATRHGSAVAPPRSARGCAVPGQSRSRPGYPRVDWSSDYDVLMRVLIADDHRLIVEGVKRALDDAPDFEVVGECNSGSQVLPLVARTNPDVVLLDLRMPGADGLACLSRIRKQHPEVKVVVLSVSTDENVIQTVLKRGASAFIVKSINPIDLPSALRQAVDGTVYSAIGLPDPGESAARAAGLTERETAILAALARGLSNEAIGKELWVAEQTVKFHLTNIYRKLGVSNRTEAERLAYQNGLVESPIDDR